MRLTWQRVALVLAAIAILPAAHAYKSWRTASNNGGQKVAQPFRIAGNLYYVGTNDVTSFVLTGPNGHVLIDGGYPGTASMIMASIASLGFNIRDVKVLLNSEPHLDHAGGLAQLKAATGAELWASDASADAIERGGAGDPFLGPLTFLTYLPFLRYPPATVDHRFKDGAKIRVGDTELTAHITAGHTPGCTTWTFPVEDHGRVLHVVHRCSLVLPAALSMGKQPKIRASFERTFRTLRALPVDIWVTAHAREFGRWKKFTARGQTADSVAPFIDREGYLRSIDSGEERFRREIAD